MIIGACTIELELPEGDSLKDKRSVLKTLMARLHKEFNISAAEVGFHDELDAALLGITTVSTSAAHAQNLLRNVIQWLENYRPDLEVVDEYMEIIHFSSVAGNK